jgi:hypothetical protein
MKHIPNVPWCRYILMLGIALIVPACGGGSGGGGQRADSTGFFIDSPVSGLSYQTSGGRSGVTGPDGSYSYVEGETVTFFIGAVVFPTIEAGPRITPFTVFGTSDATDPRVVNLARLLQTLDTDGDPANGITISPSATAAATAPVDFSDPSFDTDPTVVNLLDNGGGSNVLVSGGQAIAHLQSQTLVGSWYVVLAPGVHSTIVITFFPDGTYLMAEDGDPGTDPNGQDGMERGTYSWDPATGAFSATTTVDTSGQWGLSHPQGAVTVTISGDVLTYGDSGGNAYIYRLLPDASAIVGTWYVLEAPGVHSSFALTFFADGTYLHAEDGNPGTDPNGQDGMERGTYTWDAMTGAFVATPTVDTNLEWGLSHPQGSVTVVVNGNVLTYTDSSGSTDLRRLVP